MVLGPSTSPAQAGSGHIVDSGPSWIANAVSMVQFCKHVCSESPPYGSHASRFTGTSDAMGVAQKNAYTCGPVGSGSGRQGGRPHRGLATSAPRPPAIDHPPLRTANQRTSVTGIRPEVPQRSCMWRPPPRAARSNNHLPLPRGSAGPPPPGCVCARRRRGDSLDFVHFFFVWRARLAAVGAAGHFASGARRPGSGGGSWAPGGGVGWGGGVAVGWGCVHTVRRHWPLAGAFGWFAFAAPACHGRTRCGSGGGPFLGV